MGALFRAVELEASHQRLVAPFEHSSDLAFALPVVPAPLNPNRDAIAVHRDAALAAMRSAPYGADAAIVGSVEQENPGKVYVRTGFGARRIMDMLVGEQLPRIC